MRCTADRLSMCTRTAEARGALRPRASTPASRSLSARRAILDRRSRCAKSCCAITVSPCRRGRSAGRYSRITPLQLLDYSVAYFRQLKRRQHQGHPTEGFAVVVNNWSDGEAPFARPSNGAEGGDDRLQIVGVADLMQRDIPADWVEQRRAFGFLADSGEAAQAFRFD